MIKWCAYCQEFQGEVPPYDSFEITHGMCEKCSKSGIRRSDREIDIANHLKEIQTKLRIAGTNGDVESAKKIIEDAEKEDIRPIEIFMGLIGPSLYWVGELWKQGLITVSDQHRFSETYECILNVIKHPHHQDEEGHVEVLLMNVPGNEHTLGIRLLQEWLSSHKISTKVLPLEINPYQTVTATQKHSPRVLGISVSMPEQLSALNDLLHLIQAPAEKSGTLITIGGNAIKNHFIREIPNTVSIADPYELIKTLSKVS